MKTLRQALDEFVIMRCEDTLKEFIERFEWLYGEYILIKPEEYNELDQFRSLWANKLLREKNER